MNITKSIKFMFVALSIFTSTMSFAQANPANFYDICHNTTPIITSEEVLKLCEAAKPDLSLASICKTFASKFTTKEQVKAAMQSCFDIKPSPEDAQKFIACNSLATNSLEIKIGCVKSAFSVDQIMKCKVKNELSINNQLSCLNKLLEGK